MNKMVDHVPIEIAWGAKSSQDHKVNYSSIINRIQNIPNPYIGNKKKLLGHLANVIEKRHLEFSSVLDAFSGSSVVSLFFKEIGKKVIANDILASSYFHAVALVENDNVRLSEKEISYLINNQNPLASTFVRDNWTARDDSPVLSRRFTPKEAEKLDNLRANIKDLTSHFAQGIGLTANNLVCMRLPFGFADRSVDIYNHRKKQLAKYGKGTETHDRRIGIYYDENMDLNFENWFPKYVRSLQSKTTEEQVLCNDTKMSHAWMIHGVQSILFKSKAFSGGFFNCGQILRNVDDRVEKFGEIDITKKDFHNLTFSNFAKESRRPCIATNSDVIDLLSSGFVDVDCVYFDPPYGGNSSDYGNLYRFFEEYIYEDRIENLPHYTSGKVSRFSNKKNYESNFKLMLEAAEHIPIWIFSYNDSSWSSLEEINSILTGLGREVTIDSFGYKYNYRDKKNKNLENEHIIVACSKK